MNRPSHHRRALVTLGLAVCGGLAAAQAPEPVLEDVRRLLASGRYDEAEATALTAAELVRVRAGDNSVDMAGAMDTVVRAKVLNGRAANPEALTLAQVALRTKESRLGIEHPDLVPSLLNLGDVLVAAGDFQPAIAATQRAVILRERTIASGPLETALALDHLGRARSAARRYEEALQAFERSVALKQQAPAGVDGDIARTFEDITLVLQRTGEYAKASAMLQRALAIRDANPGHPAYATTLNLLAQQLWFEGDLVASRDASARAVEVAERTLRPDHPTIALSLRYLGAIP